MRFNGHYKCTVDSSLRIKLPPAMLFDFGSVGSHSIVFYCLPEGCLGIFPAVRWEDFCQKLESESDMVLTDLDLRRQRRRIGAMSLTDEISSQGRITIPASMRETMGFKAGDELVIVGARDWVEVWKAEDWDAEVVAIGGKQNTTSGTKEG